MKPYLTLLFLGLAVTAGAAETETVPAGECRGILSGAVSGAFKCVIVAGFGFKPGVGVVSFTPAAMPAGIQNVTAAFSIDGAPHQGEFSYDNCTDCTATVTRNDGAMFMAQKKGRSGSTNLKVTSASILFPTPDGTLYTVHGTIEADMPQTKPDGSHGSAHMQVEF